MVEFLRDFKISIYMDTNKRTVRKNFDVDSYPELNDLLDEVEYLIDQIKMHGPLEAL